MDREMISDSGPGTVHPFRILVTGKEAAFRRAADEASSNGSDLAVVGEVNDGVNLLAALNRLRPDMIILDLSIPNLEGTEAISKIKTISPDTKVLVLARTLGKEDLRQALSAGAEGYLLKEDLETNGPFVIDTIRGGGIYLSPVFREELTDDWIQTCRQKWALPSGFLTAREKEVLNLIGQGMSSKEIAGLLFVSPRTVEHHRANIMNKLSLKKGADLIKYALCNGHLL